MVGYRKWSKVKHIKGPPDLRRGAAFSKLVQEITVAARLGSSELSGHPRLRSFVDTARAANLPKDNMERASRKSRIESVGAHTGGGSYVGSAPGRVATRIEATTNHKNRTAADLRFRLSKNHGSFAISSGVSDPLHQEGQPARPCSLTDERPDNTVAVTDKPAAARVLHLYEVLDDEDDNQHVYFNFAIPEETLARLSA